MTHLGKAETAFIMSQLLGRALEMNVTAKETSCGFSCDDNGVPTQVEHCMECPVRDLAVCSSLNNDEIGQLAQFVVGQEFSSGHDLFVEGDDASAVYTVTEGAVKTHKLMPDGRRQITGFFFAGDFVGLAHGDTCAYSAEAAGPIRVCRFDRKRFDHVLDEFPKMRSRLLSEASDELAAAHNQMLLLGRKTAKERLATFLLMVDQRTAQWRQNDDILELPMTRGDIADYLGLTTETVSRTFTQFRSAGLIAAHGTQDVKVLDREGLEDAAEG